MEQENGVILIIEDDQDDSGVLLDIMEELGLKQLCRVFDDGDEAFDFIANATENIILILSDISLPRMDGLELKKKIEDDEALKAKSIPFIFFTAVGRQEAINEAFVAANIHGYFNKPADYYKMKEDIKIIFDYWSRSQRPSR